MNDKNLINNSNEMIPEFQTQLLDAIDEAIIATNIEGKIIYWNKAAEALYGWKSDEIVGNSILDITPTEDSRENASEIMTKLSTGQSWRGEFPVKRKDGSEFFAEVKNHPIHDENGKLIGIIGISTDATEKRKIENEAILRSLSIDSSSDAIGIISTQGIVLDLNDQMLSMTGFENKNDIIGKNFRNFVFDAANYQRIIHETMKQGVASGKGQIYTAEGDLIQIEYFVTKITNSWDETICLLASLRNITGEILRQEELEESKQKYHDIFEGVGIGLVYTDRKGVVLDANSTFYEITELKKEEVIGKNSIALAKKFLSFKDIPRVIAEVSKSMAGNDISFELNYKGKILEIYTKVSRNRYGVTGIIRDITEKYEAARALRESEEKFRNLANNLPVVTYLCKNDKRWTMLFINDKIEDILGYPKELFLSNEISFADLYHPDELGNVYKAVSDTINKGKLFNMQYRIKHRNGSYRWVEEIGIGIKNEDNKSKVPDLIEGSILDITDKIEAEKALQESEEMYRTLFNNSPIGICTFSSDGRILEINQELVNLLGSPSIEMTKKINMLEFPLLKNAGITDDFIKCFETGKKITSIKYYYTKWNKTLFLRYHIAPIKDEEGNVRFAQALVEDFTDRKEYEEALKESEEKYRKLVDNSLVGFYIIQDNKLIFCNDRMREIFGYDSLDELIGTNIEPLISEKSLPLVRKEINMRLTGEKEVSHNEFNAKRKDGNIIDVVSIGSKIIYNNKPAIQGTIFDITESNKAKEDLQKISKLESIGILGGGIAHNFKNMLTAMSLSVEIASSYPEKAERHFEKLRKGIEQATALATRFQSFTSSGEPIKDSVNICNVIDEAQSIALSGSNITCKMKSCENITHVHADSRQMNEVFMNLFINSKEAMEKGGEITVEAENIIVSKNEYSSLIPGEYVKIKLIDQGTGIDEDIIRNIFDPFFTTKENGHGLGLSSVHYIIQKHNGIINVKSEKNIGSKFEIILPAALDSRKKSDTTKIEKESLGNIRILLMDDDDNIRENMIDLASIEDLDIVCVSNGLDALKAMKEAENNNKPFDLAILDLIIKGSAIGGEEVLTQLKGINPNIKSIVFSGYSVKPIVANYEEYGFDGRLEKPIKPEDFYSEIKNVMK